MFTNQGNRMFSYQGTRSLPTVFFAYVIVLISIFELELEDNFILTKTIPLGHTCKRAVAKQYTFAYVISTYISVIKCSSKLIFVAGKFVFADIDL